MLYGVMGQGIGPAKKAHISIPINGHEADAHFMSLVT